MELQSNIIEKLKVYGVGHRKLNDILFADDKPPARLGIFDEADENLCHEVVKTICHIPGCLFYTDSLLEFENHYNAAHRYSCSQCKKVLPSPHLLDLHIQETHDSFFSVLALKKPSYSCYIEECKEKFLTPENRREHCVNIHKLPKDFRFDQRPRSSKTSKKQSKTEENMEVEKAFKFNNCKAKAFSKYTGKKFTSKKTAGTTSQDVNMEEVVEDLRNSLPE